jgi:hypothetical protein
MSHDDDTCPHLVRANLLEAKNARLKAEVERLTAFTTRTIIPNEELQSQVERLTDKIRVSDNHAQCLEFVINSGTANELRLQAQVERLTKAGDAMVDMVDWEVSYERRKNLEAEWNAAKEGKGQP